MFLFFFFFFKQKTAYEISTRDWSSDVSSSDLPRPRHVDRREVPLARGEARIVWRRAGAIDVVRFGELDLRLRAQLRGENRRVGLRAIDDQRGVANPLQVRHRRPAAANLKWV